ncbi:MAG: SGNH/GDSL hydrolase N-terminal domain-containing protein, partial [Candidatus Neomarinimicrobiota bacterium]
MYSRDSQGLVEPNGERKILFQRLPQRYQVSLRKDVWELSENSAGVSISFKTNSSELSVKWTIKLDFSMNHMTNVGVKGIDLYYKENGKWDYLSSGIPSGKRNKVSLFKGLSEETRKFRLHLPLYDSVTDLQIGIH